jgi:Uma2 family endonuclease
MSIAEPVSERAFQDFVLREPDAQWELHDGQLREKPPMSWEHNDVMALLNHLLQQQLRRDDYRVWANAGHVRRSAKNYYIPDVIVIPAALGHQFRGKPGTLPVFRDPLPLVVEIWSPSTGDYDIDSKIPRYRARGDLEIWRLHPYERTLTAWRRQSDGSYAETVHRDGVVRPASLPGVAIELATLFDA